MPTFIRLLDNVVADLIVSNTKEEAEQALNCELEEIYTDKPFGVGWSYNAETNEFTPPVLQETI